MKNRVNDCEITVDLWLTEAKITSTALSGQGMMLRNVRAHASAAGWRGDDVAKCILGSRQNCVWLWRGVVGMRIVVAEHVFGHTKIACTPQGGWAGDVCGLGAKYDCVIFRVVYNPLVMAKDLYEILGVSCTASDDELKRAYRKLAQKHHPDRNKGNSESETRFKEINGAYQILSDKQKRQAYDQFGESAFRGGGGGGSGGMGGFDFSGAGFGEGFADIFETFFGGGGAAGGKHSRNAPVRGDDREIAITVTFDEAAFGVEKEVKTTRIGECETCGGDGAAKGSKIIECPVCKGAGEIREVRSTILGHVTTRRVCDSCNGVGKVPGKPCGACHGASRIRGTEKIRVKIPAGIAEGSIIRIAGKGDSGVRGGEGGDLYVHIAVSPHELFRRREADVFSEQSIHLVQAVLGDIVEIKTVDGSVSLRIPSGTESGKVFRLKDHGVQKLRSSGKGDHFVTIKIDIPKKLSKREREIFQELARESGLKINEDKGFIKRMMGE